MFTNGSSGTLTLKSSDPLTIIKGSHFFEKTLNDENIAIFINYFKSKGATASKNAEGNLEVLACRDWLYRITPLVINQKEINDYFAQQKVNNPSPITEAISPVINFMYKQPVLQKAYENRVPLALAAVGFAGMVAGACAMRYKLRP